MFFEDMNLDQQRKVLENSFEVLSERERRIIELRYGLNDCSILTLREIGDIFGITRERVRQLEAKSLRRMRKVINVIFKEVK